MTRVHRSLPHVRFLSSALVATACVLAGCGAPAPGEEDSASADVASTDLWGGPAWTATRAWDQQAEDEFSAWVARLGTAREQRTCITLQSCIASPQANSLHGAEDEGFTLYADCADVPLFLRAYFARKKRLPFSLVTGVAGQTNADGTTPVHDTRTSLGNRPTSWHSHLQFKSLKAITYVVNNWLHTGSFRMAPEVEKTDTFPVDINRQTVRPGTVFHVPGGHIALVYKVSANGKVGIVDGHPDNTFTVYDSIDKFFNEPGQMFHSRERGGGFRNFRWYRVANGQIVYETNAEAAGRGMSDSQYRPNPSYDLGGRTGTYGDYVYYRLTGDNTVDPVARMDTLMDTLCSETYSRVDAVELSTTVGLPSAPHPGLPSNIYSTVGDWESYSTPSRDLRYRGSFLALTGLLRAATASVAQQDGEYDYDGSVSELIDDMQAVWDTKSKACKFAYRSSMGQDVWLDLTDVMTRLWDLSFDPYHCPEMRWGANPAGAGRAAHQEYATCPADVVKEQYFWLEERLRNATEKSTAAMTSPDSGPATHEVVDIPALFAELRAAHGGQAGPPFGEIACPSGYALTGVGTEGGQYCTDGTNVWGPFTQKMVSKCRAWGGGDACDSQRWSKPLFLGARGTALCMDGASYDALTWYCTEGEDAFGPFPPALVDKCIQWGGGETACRSARWNRGFLAEILGR